MTGDTVGGRAWRSLQSLMGQSWDRLRDLTTASPSRFAVGVFLTVAVYGAVALLVKIDTVSGQDMPLLTLITDINPTVGLIMSLVIFGMIFATSLGMFYALGKRLARGREDKFRVIFIAACVIGR